MGGGGGGGGGGGVGEKVYNKQRRKGRHLAMKKLE